MDKAQSILDKGQIGDALRKFEGLVNKYPKSPRALYGKAQSLDKLADLKQSNEVLQQSIEAYGNVVTLPDCPLELKRRVMRRQADRLSFLGRIGQAANVLKKLLNLFPGDIKLMNELGVQYLLSGRNRDAESIYNQVQLKPSIQQRRGSLALWLEHYTYSPKAPSSSPTLTASWICSW